MQSYSFYLVIVVSTLLFAATLPSACQGQIQRRAWRDLSCTEQNDFLRAMNRMKENGRFDLFAQVHMLSRSTSHGVDAFLPWHRWFIWQFERELGVMLPYWDWERPDSQDTVFKASSFGTRQVDGNGCVLDGVFSGWRVQRTEGCVERDFNDRFLPGFSSDVEILSRITNNDNYQDFRPALEGGPHSAAHFYVGGSMGSREGTADDPIFYLHHANVDRIWVLWQDYHQHDLVGETRYGWQHYSGDNLDTPMQFLGSDRILDFTVPGTNQPPTPRQVLTNFQSLVDVTYINDNLGLQLTRADNSYGSSNAYGISGNNRNWITMSNDIVNERCTTGTGDTNRGSSSTNNAAVPSDQRTGTNNSANNAGGLRLPNGQGTFNTNTNNGFTNGPQGTVNTNNINNNGFTNGQQGTVNNNNNNGFTNGQQGTVNNNNNNGFTNERNDFPWADNLPTVPGSSNNNPGLEQQQPICNNDGEQCQQARACCGGNCYRNLCCRLDTLTCSSSTECCSGFCGWGTCRERTRELVDRDYHPRVGNVTAEEQEDREDAAADAVDPPQQQQQRQAPDFSNPTLNPRWVDLTVQFPHEPTRVLEHLAREDCEQRLLAHPDLRSATAEWMRINNMTDTPQVFDCHYLHTRELVHDDEPLHPTTLSAGCSLSSCQTGPLSFIGFLAACLLLLSL